MTSQRRIPPKPHGPASRKGKTAPQRTRASKSTCRVQGISIPKSLRHAGYFKRKELWYLCTQSAIPLAKFESLEALQRWWTSFLVKIGKPENKVTPLKRPETKLAQQQMRKFLNGTNFAAVKLVRDKTPSSPQSTVRPSSKTPDSGTISTTKPAPDRIHWNDEYDMPEF